MLLYVTALCCLGGGGLLVLLTRPPLTVGCGTLAALCGNGLAIGVAVSVLWHGQNLSLHLPWGVPGAEFALLIDPLSAFFLLPITLVSALCAVYAGPYLHPLSVGCARLHWFFFNLMNVSMLLVVSAANVLLLLLSWEVMTISSFLLVAWEHRRAEVRRAAWRYLLVAHLGMMLLTGLFLLAATWCQSSNFRDFAPLSQLSSGWASLLFLLALGGFGVKAGVFPLHIWLPEAHPAAPSHVSALMSAVLIKTGLYGILRVLSFLPAAPAWWGWLLVVLGAVGAVYGISLAALQSDIKRCLAYSTIENIAIILIGFGFGLVALDLGHTQVALLCFAGGLLHIWNHALFKGLMFLGAGSLAHGTGSRDLNQLGGLLKPMPQTAKLCIGGALAISALPPLNGLVSEWLIYLGLLQAGTDWIGFIALPALLLISLLAVVGALAVLTFVRFIGLSLLGNPRSKTARSAHEAPLLMRIPMALLLLLCLAVGLFPAQVLSLLENPLALLLRHPLPSAWPVNLAPLGAANLGLLLLLVLVTAGFCSIRQRRPKASAPTWSCAYPRTTSRMAYTAGGFSALLHRQLLPRSWRAPLSGTPVSGLCAEPAGLHQTAGDPVLERCGQPLFAWLAAGCEKLHRLQQGQLAVYLLYMFIASTLLLSWSVWTSRGG
jgi:formate hydrogenlyase subunit 3/multisubunit Na+/H+ antiporter MnhD subunit